VRSFFSFFTPEMQAMLAGSNAVGDKPDCYGHKTLVDATAAGS